LPATQRHLQQQQRAEWQRPPPRVIHELASHSLQRKKNIKKKERKNKYDADKISENR
jgi:hypothetical protein